MNILDKKTNTYLYEYYYDDLRWHFEIKAYTKEDADVILRQLPWAKYIGELQFTIPAFKTKWLANLIIWWKNLNK